MTYRFVKRGHFKTEKLEWGLFFKGLSFVRRRPRGIFFCYWDFSVAL